MYLFYLGSLIMNFDLSRLQANYHPNYQQFIWLFQYWVLETDKIFTQMRPLMHRERLDKLQRRL